MNEKNNYYHPQKIEIKYSVNDKIIPEAIKKEKEIIDQVNEMWDWTERKVLPRLIIK